MQHPNETIRLQTQKKKIERRKTEVTRESLNENNEQQCNLNEQKKILINLNRNVKSEKRAQRIAGFPLFALQQK